MPSPQRNDTVIALLIFLWALYGLTIVVVLVVSSLVHKPVAIIVWFLVSWAGLSGIYALLAFLDHLTKKMIIARFEAEIRGEMNFCPHCAEHMLQLQQGKFVRLGRLRYLALAVLRCEGWIGQSEPSELLEEGENGGQEVEMQDRAQGVGEAPRRASV